jgi:hypothetical protein
MKILKNSILSLLFISLSMFGLTAIAVSPDEITVKNMTVEEAMVSIAEMEAEAEANGGGTADGLTPAVEDICTKWGFTGKVNGLCNAYCEAMDCDSPAPQASEQACTRVFDKIVGALDGSPFPECRDEDDDGIPNGVDNCPLDHNQSQIDEDGDEVGDACDNCPAVPNSDQSDSDSDGIGDVCDDAVSACPCYGMSDGPYTWSTDFPAESGGASGSTVFLFADSGNGLLGSATNPGTCVIHDVTTPTDIRIQLTPIAAEACRTELLEILNAIP